MNDGAGTQLSLLEAIKSEDGNRPFAQSFAYRTDIDGLRAIAVLSVILFHLGLSPVSGGFTGVDVFFVISGYLITKVILKDATEGRFTFAHFYERRIRRIFPALLFVVSIVMALGWLTFMPSDLKSLGSSATAAMLSASNILFWIQADYFAGPVESKPLLHTWSLAVEEQFYIVLPVLVIVLHKSRRFPLRIVIPALVVVSFALSCAWTRIDPSGNYYLPHTRAWELGFGSVVALGMFPAIRSSKISDALSLVALALIIAPIFLLTGESTFPAWNAVPTCLGTAMLIGLGETRPTVAGRAIGNRLMVGLGLISYSLYLVHWPLIVFFRYAMLRAPDLLEMTCLFIAMVVLAWGCWRWVERPFRSPQFMSSRSVFLLAGIVSLILASLGGVFFLAKGFPARFGQQAEIAMRDTAQTQQRSTCFLKGSYHEWEGDKCFITQGTVGPKTLLWGDSHASQYREALAADVGSSQTPILLYASAGCPPILGVDFKGRRDCRENNDQALKIISDHQIERVVLSAHWQLIMDENDTGLGELKATINQLRTRGLQVRLIGDNPEFDISNPNLLGVRLLRRSKPNQPYYASSLYDPDFNLMLANLVGPGDFFDPNPALCRGGECLVYRDGKLIMFDNSHLSQYGAGLLMPDLRSLFV